jgi:hypothetical protein
MKNNLFDAHVKEQLAGSRPDVPAHIWENIIAKKEREKPVGFWLNNFTKIAASALLLLTGAGVFIYLYSNKNEPTTKHAVISITKTTDNISPQTKTDKTTSEGSKDSNLNTDDLNNNLNVGNNLNPIIATNKLTIPVKKYDSDIFSSTENNVLPFEDNSNSTYIINKQILDASLLRSSFFNPGLRQKKLPLNTFIPCPEVEKDAAGSKRYIEIYGGPDYVFRTIADTANSLYLQQRKASTKYLFAYSAGIRYTRVFGSGMSFRTGLNYSQINEQFTAEKGRVIQNIYVTNSNGDTTGTYVQTGTLYKQNTNKYKSIDIPLSVGYELGNGRIHTNINAGAIINISSSQKGFVLDKSGNAVDISSKTSSSIYRYKAKAGVSFIGAVSVYYKLNDQLHLMAEPYIKVALSPATKAELSLKEKFHTAGLRLGVRMDF